MTDDVDQLLRYNLLKAFKVSLKREANREYFTLASKTNVKSLERIFLRLINVLNPRNSEL